MREKRISPAVVLIPIGLGLAALLAFYAFARAAAGFSLRVENAPAPATQWMARCNYYSTAEPVMPSPLPLSERWICTEPAPAYNTLGIACFDAAGYIVQESIVVVTIEDGKDYTFDFTTETLKQTPIPIRGG